MSGDKDTASERQARLARALRENLKRRKGQARARAEEPVPPKEDEESTSEA